MEWRKNKFCKRAREGLKYPKEPPTSPWLASTEACKRMSIGYLSGTQVFVGVPSWSISSIFEIASPSRLTLTFDHRQFAIIIKEITNFDLSYIY